MNHLVIGSGQIGTAISQILKCDIRDIEKFEGEYGAIHICFPYSDRFISQVKKYKKEHNARYVVIHSTVPVGTSRTLEACHSPITGKHPDLYESILLFTKLFAGRGAKRMAEEFDFKGCETKVLIKPENTEAGKLWALNIYGLNVMIEKEIYKYCEENKLDFNEVYTDFVEMYNGGYNKMGLPQFQQYNLKHMEGKIGGHCIIQNMDNLNSPLSSLLKKLNDGVV